MSIDKAKELGLKNFVVVKAMQLAPSNGLEMSNSSWDGSYLLTTRIASERAYKEVGIKNPEKEIHLTEVHDCFSITELVVMEDLGLCGEGRGVNAVLDGKFDKDGKIPVKLMGVKMFRSSDRSKWPENDLRDI